MKVALLQTRQRADSHASNLQLIIAAVVEAVRAKPAPDLLILPAGCDSGGRDTSKLTRTITQCVREAISWHARKYGVYIAAGLHALVDGRWMPCAVLVDPDGDAVSSSTVGARILGDDTTAPVVLRRCELGCVGIRALTADCAELPAMATREGMTVLILPSPVGYRDHRHGAERDVVNGLRDSSSGLGGAWCCVVTPASPTARVVSSANAGTFIADGQGSVVTQATTAGQQILFGDVPHQPVALRTVGNDSSRGRGNSADGLPGRTEQ